MVEFFYDFDRLTLLRLRALREGEKILTMVLLPKLEPLVREFLKVEAILRAKVRIIMSSAHHEG